ncbi:hypothetical protein Nocox_29865 [Nonomuraea coxensis DSM 45129]|uniref:Uncharacterized protein n=1 Tax=Nonomuraea coxensis DSM 45129 TaxID=1122611 RepID=A0ABX8UA73_9ACTN|nr:hypothetical protein [Nonomuraea coxensis]QYC43557.1 hypothetical protein Nocox_29865 [Nonomuraea coxensis DSM 45129]
MTDLATLHALLPLTNGPTAALYERLGAGTLNVATDLTVPHLAEIRAATGAALVQRLIEELDPELGGRLSPAGPAADLGVPEV